MDYEEAFDWAYHDGGVDANVSYMTFGAAGCYRATYSTLVSVEYDWANTTSVFQTTTG